jgi:biopolymer transport protein ExbD
MYRVPVAVPRRPRVDMVPLIDMFFLMLTFFIFGVFSMSLQQGIHVDLPSAETAAPSREATVTVSVDAAGGLFVNHAPVSRDTLAGALRAAQAHAVDPLVVLNADQGARHGVVVDVLDEIRRAGLTRVSIQAGPKE